MDQSFDETLSTLRKAHYSLRQETEGLARYQPIDVRALQGLSDIARSFREQAHSLLVTMACQKAPGTLQDETESLVRAFSEAGRQIEIMLASSKRTS